jgi:predicted nucleotidyltransferase component of viral defense system
MEITNDAQLKRAILEDEIVDLVLNHYNNFVMHGGTSVWRCYGGNRFSRDVDFYSNLNTSEESIIQKQLHRLLIKNGYPVREEKYNSKTKTLHVIFKGADATGKLDITFAKTSSIVVEYLRVDGAKRMIRALDPEALFNEKMDAYANKYEKQNHEIHDLYDMVILKGKLNKPSEDTRRRLASFLSRIKANPPKDRKGLRQLLLSGITPSFSEMIGILEMWLNDASK